MRVRREPPQVLESALSRRLPPAARFVLRGGTQALAAAASALGLPFSAAACRAQTLEARAALWLGPDERLLIGPEQDAHAMRDSLERSLGGIAHSLVEVSHRQTALEVIGPHAAGALNVGCPLDLHPGAFPVGMCTRTVFNKAEIVLWRTAAERFRLEVSRSYAAYVSSLLAEAASELE
jgi:sarcosine oxidase, subunit gamma